jgi:hypothetical protein
MIHGMRMGMNPDPHTLALMLLGKRGLQNPPDGAPGDEGGEGPDEESSSDQKVAMHEFMTAVHGHDANGALIALKSLVSLIDNDKETGDDTAGDDQE